ncbi:MAG: efflux RND transporter periplasmic adaptor subunit [Candidatus Symbiothrix sp.]|jgi:HlyD family secretion protein|nr:efflux RND transporter periplasmic adaptor subunit [Candidatus Symbiothrix sp.]
MKKVGKYVLFGLLGIILIITFKFLWDDSHPKAIEYALISPQKRSIENKKTATGNVEPRYPVLAKPKITGTISKIFKEAGEKVKEGEVIALVEVITDPTQLNSAESRLRIADITLEQVSKEYERQSMLYKNDVISRNEYELAEASYRKAIEEKSAGEDALEILKRGVAKSKANESNTQVRSKISGMILDIPVKEGNAVIMPNQFSEGTTIATVANMNDLIFRGTIDETEVGQLKIGMPVVISIGAISSELFDARLEYISPKGGKENGAVLYELKAAIQNPQTEVFIRSDYSANADIVVEQINDVITIPESIVEFNNKAAFVYVLQSGNSKQQFEKKQIEIGLSDGTYVEIKSGLDMNDKIRGAALTSTQK